ncbi:hypothetical protein HK101_001791 [Irineochytrium annulatum]|nr:hypothetical protein HK101_001791 [Irineochytrium annulatum]
MAEKVRVKLAMREEAAIASLEVTRTLGSLVSLDLILYGEKGNDIRFFNVVHTSSPTDAKQRGPASMTSSAETCEQSNAIKWAIETIRAQAREISFLSNRLENLESTLLRRTASAPELNHDLRNTPTVMGIPASPFQNHPQHHGKRTLAGPHVPSAHAHAHAPPAQSQRRSVYPAILRSPRLQPGTIYQPRSDDISPGAGPAGLHHHPYEGPGHQSQSQDWEQAGRVGLCVGGGARGLRAQQHQQRQHSLDMRDSLGDLRFGVGAGGAGEFQPAQKSRAGTPSRHRMGLDFTRGAEERDMDEALLRRVLIIDDPEIVGALGREDQEEFLRREYPWLL